MSTPKVSIIVPFYNSEVTLPSCLESLRAQTLKDIEIILVDDGSTDNSLTVARDFAKSFKCPYTVLSQENKGPSAARNKGLDVAKGEFVAFVDSDDTVDPTIYEKMIVSADKYDSDIVSCGRVAVDEATAAVIAAKVPSYDVLEGPIAQCPDIVKRVGPLMCDKMFRRSIIEEHDIRFDEDIWYAEDFLFGAHVKLHVRRVSTVREALYRYIQVEGSITNSTSHVMDIPEVARRVIALYENGGLLNAVREPLLYVLVGYYLRRCRVLPLGSNLWISYKSDFKDLFNCFFGKRWVWMIGKRIIREDKGLRRLTLFVKAVM